MSSLQQNCMYEWSFETEKQYKNPFNDIEMDVVFTGPDAEQKKVPAFWAGGNLWKVRYATPITGQYSYETICSDQNNSDLHRQKGEFSVTAYDGDNSLLKHGRLQIAKSGRYLEHSDGTPFFWQGDTWWYGLIGTFRWPEEFKELVADRVEKGFNLIQIVAGYLPAMPEGDKRDGNEGGFPWSSDYNTINPDYFNLADLRIDYLVQNGLVPCIVGMWGYWLERLGVENVKKHWRNLVARYGAYPVVWCLCGEVQCIYPDFLSEDMDVDIAKQTLKNSWSDVCRYVHDIDPYCHPLTAHPNGSTESRDMLDEDVPLSVAMLQTGHSFHTLPGMIEIVKDACSRSPRLPVINGEACYESILGSSWQDVQRFMIWTCVLNGTAGHTYGAAEGCWHIHHRDQEPFPFTSGVWGEYHDWHDIAAFPGSGQMQYCRKLMEQYDWWEFEPHPEWLELKISSEKFGDCFIPRVSGIPGEIRVIYLPPASYCEAHLIAIKELEPNLSYRACFYDPRSGGQHDIGLVIPKDGCWLPPKLPNMQDWVLVLEKENL